MSCSGPSINPDCADPAYREAHPDECEGYNQLRLVPEYALLEPGQTQQYKVFLRADGQEMELTRGLEFFSSNPGAALVNQEGLATGVAPGISTISVEWQDQSAHAQLEVVASCAETRQNFLILIDNSRSMGQAFSSSYASKLAFSKQTASEFCDTVNLSKDRLAVFKFADNGTKLEDWTDDATEAKAAVQSISTTSEKTNIADGLQDAIDYFTSSAVPGVKVILIFSDGENTGDDPLPIARQFKEAGGIIVSIATASWGDGFILMAEISTGGFLLSAYEETDDGILEALSGLKSFICASQCFPEETTAPYAELNYTDFINWDVIAGRVDLVGLDRWDVVPGNGLYVDLMGTKTSPTDDFEYGKLRSKETFALEAGKTYRLTHYAAGNNVNAPGTFKHRVTVGSEEDATEEYTITDRDQDFTEYELEWTQIENEDAYITIEQTEKGGHHNVGTLIDEITLLNVTDDEVLLYDNFDSENPTTLPPPPGYSYGCINSPPGAQTADPTPPSERMVE